MGDAFVWYCLIGLVNFVYEAIGYRQLFNRRIAASLPPSRFLVAALCGWPIEFIADLLSTLGSTVLMTWYIECAGAPPCYIAFRDFTARYCLCGRELCGCGDCHECPTHVDDFDDLTAA